MDLYESKEFENSTVGVYILDEPRRIIGYGGQGWVELASNVDEAGNTKYIIKFSRQEEGSHEYNIMRQLYHPHIIKVFGFYHPIHRMNRNGEIVIVSALVMEYAKNGDLFSLANKSVFGTSEEKYIDGNESIVRILFTQLVDAVEHCHSQGIVHLDIKTENVLLDDAWNVKLTDFGLAMKGYDHHVIQGTRMYFPPELFTSITEYDGRKVDIFSLGVVLFIMIMGYQPWKKTDDVFYNCIRTKDFESFWRLHAKYGRVLSKSVQFLLTRMFEDADFRITIDGIKKSKWFMTPIYIEKEKLVTRFDNAQNKEGRIRKRSNSKKMSKSNYSRNRYKIRNSKSKLYKVTKLKQLKIPKMVRY